MEMHSNDVQQPGLEELTKEGIIPDAESFSRSRIAERASWNGESTHQKAIRLQAEQDSVGAGLLTEVVCDRKEVSHLPSLCKSLPAGEGELPSHRHSLPAKLASSLHHEGDEGFQEPAKNPLDALKHLILKASPLSQPPRSRLSPALSDGGDEGSCR